MDIKTIRKTKTSIEVNVGTEWEVLNAEQSLELAKKLIAAATELLKVEE